MYVKTNMFSTYKPQALADFLSDLIDGVGLCGGFCVWLADNRKDVEWLNGRFTNATWDVNELLSTKDAVVEGNLLTTGMRLP